MSEENAQQTEVKKNDNVVVAATEEEVEEFSLFTRQQNELNGVMLKQLEKICRKVGASEPPKKKQKVSPEEATGTSNHDYSKDKEKENEDPPEPEISVHVSPEDRIADIVEDSEEEEDPWGGLYQRDTQPGSKDHEGNGASGIVDPAKSGENSVDTGEDAESSRYQGLIDQTEEIVGEPIEEKLAQVCNKVWGKVKLDSERKKTLLKGKFNTRYKWA